jgi:hypothetical protein
LHWERKQRRGEGREERLGVVVLNSNPSYSGVRSAQAKLTRPYLKNKMQTKGLGAWLKRESTCLECTRPWVLPQVEERKEERKKGRKEERKEGGGREGGREGGRSPPVFAECSGEWCTQRCQSHIHRSPE